MRHRIASCGFVILLVPLASGTTYLVRPDGTGDFPTIQAAIDAADSNDVIELASGTFSGDGNRDIDYLGKSITVSSQSGDPDSCIIDCEASASDPHTAFLFQAGENSITILRDVTIRNGYGIGEWPEGGAGGILCANGSSPTILNCRLHANWGTAGGAIYCFDSSSPTISDCHFIDNGAEQSGGALFCLESSCPEIIACQFIENHAPGDGSAIYCRDMSSPRIQSSTFACNSGYYTSGAIRLSYSAPVLSGCTLVDNEGAGIVCSFSSPTIENTIIALSHGQAVRCNDAYCYPELICCNLFGNYGGDWAGTLSSQYGINGNISQDPQFCRTPHNPDEPYRVHTNSPCAPESNPDCGLIGAWPVGCEVQVFLVRSDGSGDFPTIQEAINASLDDDTIELAEGEFNGDGNRDLEFLGKAITLQSESNDPTTCTIDCEGSDNDQHRGVFFRAGEGRSTILRGIRVFDGYKGIGGGIYFDDLTSPTLDNCIIEACSYGSGLFCDDGASPLVLNCIIRNNASPDGGGITCRDGSSIEMQDCEISYNWAWGNGGGILAYEDASVALLRCTLVGNAAHLGGGMYLEDDSGSYCQELCMTS